MVQLRLRYLRTNVTRALTEEGGGGGEYSFIHVLPD